MDQIPSRARWQYTDIILPGFSEIGPARVWHRDILAVLKSIIAQPNLAHCMLWAPEMHYSGDTFDEKRRQFGELNTGDHWWKEQATTPPRSTVLPLLISTDKTCMTLIGGSQVCYPVGLAPAIVPGPIRSRISSMTRQLLAYIPVKKATGLKGSQDDISRYNLALYHAAMSVVIRPLVPVMVSGFISICGDGFLRNFFPTIPSFPIDNPEQGVVTCTRGCGICDIADEDMGKNMIGNIRRPADTLNLLHIAGNMSSVDECEAFLKEHRLKHVFRPFWEGLTRCNVHLACTTDVLHQIWQGIIKYLTLWGQIILGKVEFDARVRRLAPCHGSRHFADGVSGLTQMSGREHRQVGSFLLAILQGVPNLSKKDQTDLSTATRALVDFAYLVEYPRHDEGTLAEMQERLNMWHEHQDVFLRLTPRQDMNIPKLHHLHHAMDMVRLVGSLKYVSTDESEASHIEFAKEPFRASNKRNPESQMVTSYDRLDKIRLHANWLAYREWRLEADAAEEAGLSLPPHPFEDLVKPRRINLSGQRVQLAAISPFPKFTMEQIASSNMWKCILIIPALKDFVYREEKGYSSYSVTRANDKYFFEFDSMYCWERLTLHNLTVTGVKSYKGAHIDSIQCHPWRWDGKSKELVGGRQDAVFIRVKSSKPKSGMHGEHLYSQWASSDTARTYPSLSLSSCSTPMHLQDPKRRGTHCFSKGFTNSSGIRGSIFGSFCHSASS